MVAVIGAQMNPRPRIGAHPHAPTAAAVVALSIAMAPVGCFAQQDGAKCAHVCALAARCGMLPSPLGSGDTPAAQQQSCIDRCKLSDQVSFQQVTGCSFPEPPDASVEELWCGGGAVPVCALMDACLAGVFPTADVTAAAALEVHLVSTTTPEEARRDDTCHRAPDPATLAPATCTATDIAIDSVTVTLAQRTERTLASESCSIATVAPLRIEGLKAGPVQPSAEIELTVAGASTPICRRFYGTRVVLVGSVLGVTTIPIPASSALLSEGTPCANASAGADGGAD
jgi:hypothetical protein